MSHLLSQWLQELDIKGMTPEKLDSSFKNGYLFGDLLLKLKCLEDLDGLSNGNNLEHCLQNYCWIEKKLREILGLVMTANDAFDIIQGKSGAATKWLYQIKSAVKRLPPNRTLPHKSMGKKEKRYISYPSSPTGEFYNNPIQTDDLHRQKFQDKEHEFFKDLLTAKLSKKNLLLKGNIKEHVVVVKAPPPKIIYKSPKKKKLEDPYGLEERQKAQRERDEAARRMEEIQQNKILEKKLKEEILLKEKKERMAQIFLNDANDFEAKRDPAILGNTDADNELSSTSIDQTLTDKNEKDLKEYLIKAKRDPFEHLKNLSKKLPNFKLSQLETKKYVESIRHQKLEEEAAKKDRELRRRKLILNQQLAQEEINKKQLEDIMAEKLCRHSKQERRIAEQLLQTRREKDLIRENRILREKQYAERRQKDYEEALENEFRLAEKAREEYKRKTALQLKQHLEILEVKAKAKHAKATKMVSQLVGDIIDLSLKISEYQELNGPKALPPKMLRQWKALFFHEKPLYKQFEVPIEEYPPTSKLLPNIDPDVLSSIDVLDEVEFDDFLNGKNDWAYLGENNQPVDTTPNKSLVQIVDDILEMCAIQETRPDSLQLPPSKLKLAIVGKPFSGKKTLAKIIAESYNLQILNIEDICKSALNVAKASSDKKLVSKENIGAKIKESMKTGQLPEDAWIVSLVSLAIKEVDESKSGWILVNFPRNANQAILLEKELTGFVENQPVPKGNLERDSFKRQASKILPKENEPKLEEINPASGLDAVFWLEVPNEVVLSRALGYVIDSKTKQAYHLEDNPPPVDEPGLYDRLWTPIDTGSSKKQLQYQLSYFEDQEQSIKDYAIRFKVHSPLNGAKTTSWIYEQLESVITQLISKKNEALMKKELTRAEAAAINSDSSSQSTEQQNVLKPPTAPSREITASIPKNPNHLDRSITVYGRKAPTRELAKVLYNEWISIESIYTKRMKFLFRSIRKEQDLAIRYFHDIRTHFKEYLARPDTKQDLIDLFQKEYNSLEEDFRHDNDVKAELHHRTDDLREKLWVDCDLRKEAAEQERLSIIEDQWLEDHSITIQNIYISMFQAEVDRLSGTKQFLIDYFRDAYGAILNEATIENIKINLLNSSQKSAIELSGGLLAHFQENTVKKETKLPRTSTPVSKNDKSKAPPIVTKPIIDLSLACVLTEKPLPKIDTENIQFVDLQAACDLAMNAIIDPPEPEIKETKRDKKKGASPDNETKREFVMPSDFSDCLTKEVERFRRNLEVIKKKAKMHLTELMNSGLECFVQLDKWIGARFISEMEAIRELLLVIKEAIEAEAQLANHLELNGDKFRVNFELQAVSPPVTPRPESPVEKPGYEHFTCLQILNLAIQFKEIAPSGMIRIKDFADSFIRYCTYSAGMELIPELYSGSDTQQITQMCTVMDPFETGFMSWRKFLAIQTKIFPISSLSYLLKLKESYLNCKSYENGTISFEDYESIPLWFESDLDDNSTSTKKRFDRPKKMKRTIFHVFSQTTTGNAEKRNIGISLLKEHDLLDISDDRFDVEPFLLHCCLDDVGIKGVQKAFFVLSQDSSGYCSIDELYKVYLSDPKLQIFHFNLPLFSETNRMPNEASVDDPYTYAILEQVASSSSSFTESKKIDFKEFHHITKEIASLSACPLYLLDDLTLKSRPSTSVV